MNYIYDIVLNFNKEYFEFFQWKKGDKIINVKKIPVFRVSSTDIKNFKYNQVKLNSDFIDKITDLTCFYSKMNYRYMCLVSDTNESLALMFDKSGSLIKKSSLVFDEEEEVNYEIEKEEEIKIDYAENKYRKIENITRLDKERKDYLFKFINSLDIVKDSSILKYIYYDYFEKEMDNPSRIKEIIISEINNVSSDKNKLYKSVSVLKKIKN